MNYGQKSMTLYRRWGSTPSPQKKKCKKAKWLSEEALHRAVKRREGKSKGEKESYANLNAEFQRIARRKPNRAGNEILVEIITDAFKK